jgi:hypothetical protein
MRENKARFRGDPGNIRASAREARRDAPQSEHSTRFDAPGRVSGKRRESSNDAESRRRNSENGKAQAGRHRRPGRSCRDQRARLPDVLPECRGFRAAHHSRAQYRNFDPDVPTRAHHHGNLLSGLQKAQHLSRIRIGNFRFNFFGGRETAHSTSPLRRFC